MAEQRIFTIEEVDALIPSLNELLGRQFVAQKEIEARLTELARLTGSLPQSLDPKLDDASEVERIKRDLRERIKTYEDGWQAVQALGRGGERPANRPARFLRPHRGSPGLAVLALWRKLARLLPRARGGLWR